MTYVLMFYLWTASIHAGGTVTMHDFDNHDACEHAARVAEDKFAGLASKAYWSCVPKGDVAPGAPLR